MGEEKCRTGEGKGQRQKPRVWKELGVFEEEREDQCGSEVYRGRVTQMKLEVKEG